MTDKTAEQLQQESYAPLIASPGYLVALLDEMLKPHRLEIDTQQTLNDELLFKVVPINLPSPSTDYL